MFKNKTKNYPVLISTILLFMIDDLSTYCLKMGAVVTTASSTSKFESCVLSLASASSNSLDRSLSDAMLLSTSLCKLEKRVNSIKN